MATQKFICPAVSVIVPLYNVEKYVGECLDSLLAQTFQDFEVIVVNDCSTDASPAIVESYAPKFGGRLKLVHMKKNSGSAGFPRNKGVELARGEYIFFVDPDDTITPTALEELYPVAKNFDADVVRCEKYFEVYERFWNDAEYRKNLKPHSYQTGGFVTEPTLISEDFADLVKVFRRRGFLHNIWAMLIRRNFVVENELTMTNTPGQDFFFAACAICSAKRLVRVPNVVYNYRIRENSMSTEKIDAARLLGKWLRALRIGVEHIDKFLDGQEFFATRKDMRYLLFDRVLEEMSVYWNNIYAKAPAYALNEIVRKELDAGVCPALKAFLCSMMNFYGAQVLQAQQRVTALENELQSDRKQLTLAQRRIAELEAELRRAN